MSREEINTSLQIESPEGISFEVQLASLSERGRAYLVDLLLRAAIMVGLGIVLGLGNLAATGTGLYLVLWFLVEWGYYVLFEWIWQGQSPGKRALNLRVTKAAGHPIGFYDSVVRNLIRGADQLPWFTYAVGSMSVLASNRFQRLGDLAAGTVVVREQHARFADRTPRLQTSGIREIVLSNQERTLLHEFALRAGRLHPERSEELASIMAASLARRLGVHAPEDTPGYPATAFLLGLHSQDVGRRAAKTSDKGMDAERPP